MKKNRLNYFEKGIKNPKNAWYVVRTNLDIMASRLIFKNTAGFKNNLEGKNIEKQLKKLQENSSAMSHPSAEQLKEKGYANLQYPFEKDLLSQIVNKYSKIIDDERFSFVRSKTKNGLVTSRMINRAFMIFPEVKGLITEDIMRLIENYYQSHFQIIHVMMWRIYHVPQKENLEKEQYGSYWHCDGANTTITTMFTNISEVTEDDGPLHFQSVQRTQELIKKGYKTRHDYNLPIEIIEDPKHVLKHVGSIGSTVWVNTQYCLHRAGIPKPNHARDMLQLRIIPSREPLYEDWLDRCEDSNDEIRFNSQK